MYAIVPLAGPDFVGKDGSIKALASVHSRPLLQEALQSRPWASAITHYSFILFDCEETRVFVRDNLSRWYQGCSVIYLSTYSRGAALSALGGLSVLSDFHKPLIIDLADVIYKADVNVERVFSGSRAIGGIALGFESMNPQYSYFRIEDFDITEAAEKKLISGTASAGTYIFRDCSVFLKAIVHAFENESTQTYNNLFYVCPLLNGVLAQGLKVVLEHAVDIIDIKQGL